MAPLVLRMPSCAAFGMPGDLTWKRYTARRQVSPSDSLPEKHNKYNNRTILVNEQLPGIQKRSTS